MENNQSPQTNDGKIDVTYIIDTIRRNWWMFAISLVACLALAVTYLYVKHDVYCVHAKVLVAYDEGGGSMGATLMQSLSLGGVGGNNVEDEILVMSSHSIKEHTVAELGLNRSYSSADGLLRKNYYYNNSPVVVNAPNELFDTLSTSLKFKIDINAKCNEIDVKVSKGMFKTIAKVSSNAFPVVVNTPYGIFSVDTTQYYVPGKDITIKANVAGNSMLAESYAEEVGVTKSEKKANGISLYTEDINIQRGKDFLNKMIELYNRRGQQEKDEMAINTGKFIDERLATLYTALSASEAEIQRYKQNNNIVDVKAEAAYLMTQKGSLEDALLKANTQHEVLKMTQEFISNPENNYSMIPFSQDIPGVAPAINTYNSLVLNRIRLEQNAKRDNSLLKAMKEQIDSVRINILTSVSRALATSEVSLNELKAKERQSASRLSQVPTQEREFLELQREQAIKNTLYSFLLQKREENQLVLAATTPKGKIVDDAFAFNKPIAPKKPMVLFLALCLGLLIPAVWLYIKPLLSNRFDSVDAIKRLTGLPILGEICHSQSAKGNPIVVSETSKRPVAELFRLLRTNMQFLFKNTSDKGRVITVTSSCSGEGKTFISMNMAETIALTNKKVVLVGLDIRLPMLAKHLNLPSAPGVTNYLSGAIDSIDQIIQRHSHCDIIVAGPIPPNPSELLLGDRIETLINTLKERYDYVILDSAPIGLVSDTFSLTKFTEVTLYVSRANYTKRNFIKYLNEVAAMGQLNNVAIIVNDTDAKLSHGYGYGYGASQKD